MTAFIALSLTIENFVKIGSFDVEYSNAEVDHGTWQHSTPEGWLTQLMANLFGIMVVQQHWHSHFITPEQT
jgi:hypothetical protein